tara:strand:- start:123 stop:350 length:228 start_codon:yes stop_codon:yes gene_type:complete
MQKKFFYNGKSIEKSPDIKSISNTQLTNKKINVDINKLLNRVKMDQMNEKKYKAIYFGIGISLIIFMGIFLTIIK